MIEDLLKSVYSASNELIGKNVQKFRMIPRGETASAEDVDRTRRTRPESAEGRTQ